MTDEKQLGAYEAQAPNLHDVRCCRDCIADGNNPMCGICHPENFYTVRSSSHGCGPMNETTGEKAERLWREERETNRIAQNKIRAMEAQLELERRQEAERARHEAEQETARITREALEQEQRLEQERLERKERDRPSWDRWLLIERILRRHMLETIAVSELDDDAERLACSIWRFSNNKLRDFERTEGAQE